MTGFEITRIPEPKLVFADGEENKDPRAGLLEHGPCPISEKVDIEVVNVGIVGSSRSISRMEELLRGMRSGIRSNENRKRWKQNFPGFDSKTGIGIDYQTLDEWKGRIRPKDMQQIEELPSREDRGIHAQTLQQPYPTRLFANAETRRCLRPRPAAYCR